MNKEEKKDKLQTKIKKEAANLTEKQLLVLIAALVIGEELADGVNEEDILGVIDGIKQNVQE